MSSSREHTKVRREFQRTRPEPESLCLWHSSSGTDDPPSLFVDRPHLPPSSSVSPRRPYRSSGGHDAPLKPQGVVLFHPPRPYLRVVLESPALEETPGLSLAAPPGPPTPPQPPLHEHPDPWQGVGSSLDPTLGTLIRLLTAVLGREPSCLVASLATGARADAPTDGTSHRRRASTLPSPVAATSPRDRRETEEHDTEEDPAAFEVHLLLESGAPWLTLPLAATASVDGGVGATGPALATGGAPEGGELGRRGAGVYGARELRSLYQLLRRPPR